MSPLSWCHIWNCESTNPWYVRLGSPCQASRCERRSECSCSCQGLGLTFVLAQWPLVVSRFCIKLGRCARIFALLQTQPQRYLNFELYKYSHASHFHLNRCCSPEKTHQEHLSDLPLDCSFEAVSSEMQPPPFTAFYGCQCCLRPFDECNLRVTLRFFWRRGRTNVQLNSAKCIGAKSLYREEEWTVLRPVTSSLLPYLIK